MSDEKTSFLATWYINTTETILLETYSSIGHLICISELIRKQCLKANLNSTAISSITAIFSCVQDNKQIKVIQWNLFITKSSVEQNIFFSPVIVKYMKKKTLL